MRTHLPRTHAHESAAGDWISSMEPNEDRDHDRDGLLREGFLTGAAWAEGECGAIHAKEQEEWSVERATGQRQLDDAAALMREAAELFRSYERHHRRRAESYGEKLERKRTEAHDAAITRMEDRVLDSTVKAGRNQMMAERIEAWLRGDIVYPITPGGDYVAHARFRNGANPAEVLRGCAYQLAEDLGTGVLDEEFDRAAAFLSAATPGSFADGGVLFAGSDTGPYATSAFGSGELVVDALPPQSSGVVNVKPVTHGLLADPIVVEGLMAASGMIDATVPLAMETATAFRLQTGDPRFDPTEPVVVNGFLYRPATEK